MAHHVLLQLDEPPQAVTAGVGVHGTLGPHDVFRLRDLWQLHLYSYSGELAFDGATHPIRPGHVSLIPPDVEAHFHYGARSCEHLYAHFRLPGRDPAGRRTVPVMQDAGAEAPLLGGLLRHAIAAMPAAPARVTAQVWTVLWHTAQLGGVQEAGRPHPALTAATAHIEEHLATPLPVADIARAAGVSHNHLTRPVPHRHGRHGGGVHPPPSHGTGPASAAGLDSADPGGGGGGGDPGSAGVQQDVPAGAGGIAAGGTRAAAPARAARRGCGSDLLIAQAAGLTSMTPPSSTRVCPVTQAASSESRNAAAPATSAGTPRRWSG